MKTATLTITVEKEKLDALIYYTQKKDVDLQTELAETVGKLYEKHVPQSTREYIEDRLIKDGKAGSGKQDKKPEPKKASSAKEEPNENDAE